MTKEDIINTIKLSGLDRIPCRKDSEAYLEALRYPELFTVKYNYFTFFKNDGTIFSIEWSDSVKMIMK